MATIDIIGNVYPFTGPASMVHNVLEPTFPHLLIWGVQLRVDEHFPLYCLVSYPQVQLSNSKDMTTSSLIESIAGFVTWANSCLK